MSTPVIIAVVSLLGSVIAAIFAWLGTRGANKVVDDANLRDDQREFIQTINKDNQDLRIRNRELEDSNAQLRKRLSSRDETIDELNAELRRLKALGG